MGICEVLLILLKIITRHGINKEEHDQAINPEDKGSLYVIYTYACVIIT